MKGIWQHLNRQRNLKTKVLKNKAKILFFTLLKIDKKTSFNADNYQSILIFAHTIGLGDAIVYSGLINILRQHNKKVYIVAEKRVSFLFNTFIPTDGVFEFDSKNRTRFKKTIKQHYFDLIVDFSDMDGTVIHRLYTLYITKYQHALSFNQKKPSLYDTNIIYHENKHISDRMLYVLKLLNLPANNYQYTVYFPQVIMRKIEKFIGQPLINKLIIFNPFASEKNRCMSNQQIYALLTELDKYHNYTTLVFDLGKDLDFSSYQHVIANPYSDFITAACLVKFADLVITVDTSIVHLATALNKRQIAIYNNRLFNNRFDNNVVWGPNSDKAVQITTREYLNTEQGDAIANLDPNIIIAAIHNYMITASTSLNTESI
jgi:ADP-heptose:LPS heptosyltransferase